MKTVKVSEVGYEAAAQEAAKVLRAGGIILYPTDTLYGLGVDALHRAGVERLISLKGRDSKKAISCIVPDVEAMERYGILSKEGYRIAKDFLPGPLTLVVPATEHFPTYLSSDTTAGLRIPADLFTRSLAQKFTSPYTATSANISSMPTLATVTEILEQFGQLADSIDLVVDDGPRSGGIPSTILRLVDETPTIVREGALSKEALGLI